MPDQFDRLATQQAAAQGQLTDRTIGQLGRLWAAVTDHGDPEQLATFVSRASVVVRTAEIATGRVTEAYLRQVLRQLDVTVPAGTLVNLPVSLRGGVPLDDVLLRPAATVRYLESVDTPRPAAVDAGLARLGAIAVTNLQLALRQATVDVLQRAPGTRGYRRILRPYLSKGGSCGLCIAAADRVYGRSDLMPIHGNCRCAVLPITKAGDPGIRLNEQDLARLYGNAAGSTEAARLKATRYRVEEHGELGAVLVPQGQRFRDAGEAASDLGQKSAGPAESYQRQLAALELSLPDLERRARAGDDVAAALTWQRARVAELRRLLVSAA